MVEMEEICSNTYENLILALTGDDNYITLYRTVNGYDISSAELISMVAMGLFKGSLIAIHIECIVNDEIMGDISHVFTIVKLDNDRYNIVQTYVGVYCNRKYTTIDHVDLITLLLELHELYSKPTNRLIRQFYSKWFYVDLRTVQYPNYLHITTI